MSDGVSVIDFLRYLITYQNDSYSHTHIDSIQTKIIINDKIIPVFIIRNDDDSIDITAGVENYPYIFTKHDNFYFIEKYVTFSSSYDAEKNVNIN